MSSSDSNPPTEDSLDRVFSALSNRTRRAQLAILGRGPCTISDLVEPFDMTFAAAAKHVRVLENAGLVERKIDGRIHRCSLQTQPLDDAEGWLNTYQDFWTTTLEKLAKFVED